MHRVYINVVVFVRSVSVIFLNVDYIFRACVQCAGIQGMYMYMYHLEMLLCSVCF